MDASPTTSCWLTPRRPEAFAVFYRRHEQTLLGWLCADRRSRAGRGPVGRDVRGGAARRAALRCARGPALAWTFGIAHHKLQRALERGRVEDRARRRLGLPPLVLEDEALERVARLGGDARVGRAAGASSRTAQAEAMRARVLDERRTGGSPRASAARRA